MLKITHVFLSDISDPGESLSATAKAEGCTREVLCVFGRIKGATKQVMAQ